MSQHICESSQSSRPAAATRTLVRSLLVSLAVCLVIVTSGCGLLQDREPASSQASGSVRTVIDVQETSMAVPQNPQRVVTLSEPALDAALALGVTPVGAVTGRGQTTVPAYLSDLASDIELLGGIGQPNYEKIASVKPDLILVDGTSVNNNPDIIAALREIAPTFYGGYAGGNWRNTFTRYADVLGRAAKGAEVLAAYDAEAERIGQELADYSDQTFSIVRWQGSSAALILNELPAGMALQDLGLRRPDNQDREGRGHSEPVALENLDEIDADWMFFGTLGGSSVSNPQAGGTADITGAQQAFEQAKQTPGFTDLKAYRNDHVILVDGSLWTSTGGPILMTRIIQNVENELS